MTFQPILAPAVLVVIAVASIGALLATRYRLRAAAALLLFVAAMRPAIGAADEPTIVAGDRNPNIFLVVDESADMSVVDDAGASRMSRAQADIAMLLDRYPDARFALIGFTDRPQLRWPLSADTWSLRPLVDVLTPAAPRPDAAPPNAGAAATVLRYQLISAGQQYPRAPNLVFYLGAGAPRSDSPTREFDPPVGAVRGGAVFGYGPADSTLSGIAAELGIRYIPRTADTSTPDTQTVTADGSGGDLRVERRELYWLPAGLAALLVLIELSRLLRTVQRNRPVDPAGMP